MLGYSGYLYGPGAQDRLQVGGVLMRVDLDEVAKILDAGQGEIALSLPTIRSMIEELRLRRSVSHYYFVDGWDHCVVCDKGAVNRDVVEHAENCPVAALEKMDE